MDSIRIDTGVKRILINDDPENFIEFNPADIGFAEKYYALMKKFQDKRDEYQQRADALDGNKEMDELGIRKNFADGLALTKEAFAYIRDEIDVLFGGGTSQKAFGDAMNPAMFEQFFAGIAPFFQTARAEKVGRYAPPPLPGKNHKKRRAVMK